MTSVSSAVDQLAGLFAADERTGSNHPIAAQGSSTAYVQMMINEQKQELAALRGGSNEVAQKALLSASGASTTSVSIGNRHVPGLVFPSSQATSLATLPRAPSPVSRASAPQSVINHAQSMELVYEVQMTKKKLELCVITTHVMTPTWPKSSTHIFHNKSESV